VPVLSFSISRGTFAASKSKIGGVDIDGPPQGGVSSENLVMQAHRKLNFQL
jgi:hypothetical protein